MTGILVVRENVEPFTVVRPGCAFTDGTTEFVTGSRLVASCGCVLEFGLRMDRPADEIAMLAFACEEHSPGWRETMASFMADEREATEALRAALTATRGGEG